jgi:uncharacterized membrane protein YedE/YeeE
MYELLFVTPWPWWAAGPALGLVVILLAWVTGKSLGVSTGYGVACALGSRLPFFQSKEYGQRWRLAFIVGLPLGGVLAALLAGTLSPTVAFGQLDTLTHGSVVAKVLLLFGGGLLIGAGARWAGGCTSGHTIVGIAQGAPSSLVATLGFMVAGFTVFNLLWAVLGG